MDIFCNNCGKQTDSDSVYCQFCGTQLSNNITPLKSENSLKETVKINTISDYLKIKGFKVWVGIKSSNKNIKGVVKDLSDDAKSLILVNVEYDSGSKGLTKKIKKLFSKDRPASEVRSKLNIPLNDIYIVQVIDRHLKI